MNFFDGTENDHKMLIGWTTTKDYEEAEKLARECVRQGLADTAQVEGPLRSFHMNNEKLVSIEEYRLILHFFPSCAEQIGLWIKKNHSQEMPQWLTVAVQQFPDENPCHGQESRRTATNEVVELSRRGAELLKQRNYDEAEKVFFEALKKEPGNSFILVGLGDLFRETKQFTRALHYYQKNLEIDSGNTFALRGIGDTYRGLNKPEKSILYWQRYLEQKSGDVHVMTRLADSYVKKGNFSTAEDLYLQALALDQNDKYVLRGIGNLYYKKRDFQQALTYFKKFLELDDRYVAVLTMTGNIYRRRREFDQAVLYYEKCLRLEPKNTFALYGMGDALRGMKNYRGAIECWEKILEKEPANQNLLSRVGDALVLLERHDEAISCYKRSLDIRDETFALLGLARIYCLRNNFVEAEGYCRKILERQPENVRARDELEKISRLRS